MTVPRVRMEIGERLRYERKLRGRSLEWLAGRAGLSRSALSRLELGQQVVNVDELERLASALDMNARDFYPGDVVDDDEAPAAPGEVKAS